MSRTALLKRAGEAQRMRHIRAQAACKPMWRNVRPTRHSSAGTHKLYAFGHMSLCTRFLILESGTRGQSFSAHFRHTLYCLCGQSLSAYFRYTLYSFGGQSLSAHFGHTLYSMVGQRLSAYFRYTLYSSGRQRFLHI
jgi:sarcosine oxidase delta subunit